MPTFETIKNDETELIILNLKEKEKSIKLWKGHRKYYN